MDRPDTVNVLLLASSLGVGGAEVVVRDLARALDRRRFSISIGCMTALGSIGSELAGEGLDISVVGNENAVDYLGALKLRQLVADKQIDVIHSHDTHALTNASLCRLLTPGVRVVHTFHFGNYPHKPRRELWTERIASRIADRLIAVGAVQCEQIKAVHALGDRSIRVIRNGVALAASSAGEPAFRTSISAEGGIVVGTICSLIPQKGLFDLLRVARRVRDVRQDVRFVVVGAGKLRHELLNRRTELGLDEAVLFPGWMTDAASRALPTFDIYFQPSLWEAMSISILEAMIAGKPVVSTLVGEAPYVIEQEREGQLFEPGDINGMSDAILALAADPGRRRAIGRAAADKVASHYTVQHMATAHEGLYLEMAPRHRRKMLRVAG
jgi:glycosyltransferase involved in cell wall biosynthesis